jgi:DNA invertase Pin-like site-specific DNA recombinase
MKYAYIRVSTTKQDYERQEYALRECGVPKENIYSETISGTKKAKTRHEFERLLSSVSKGDTIYFESMSRMARSLMDMVETTQTLVTKMGVTAVFLKENLTLSGNMDSTTSLMFNIFASLAQFERDIISERTKELIAAKRASMGADFKIGRNTIYGLPERYEVLKLRSQGLTIAQIADTTGISKSTVGRMIKEEKDKNCASKKKASA